MRAVAVLIALLALPALMPVAASTAYDQCVTGAASASACQSVTTPAGAGSPSTYYVFAGGQACTSSPTDNNCRGEGSILYGAVYRESNGLEGLQRVQTTVGGRSFGPDARIAL